MRTTVTGITSALALIGLIAVPLQARAADHPQSAVALERQATDLVERTEEIGREVQYHVDRLKMLATHPELSPWSHYQHLERIKRLVNADLRPVLARLADLQRQLPAWKQESVTRMIAAAQLLADDANSAFVTKRDSFRVPAPLNGAYVQFVTEMSVHADDLVSRADLVHQFATLRAKAAEAGLPTN